MGPLLRRIAEGPGRVEPRGAFQSRIEEPRRVARWVELNVKPGAGHTSPRVAAKELPRG